MWFEICQSAFDVALDGFSKAKKSNAVVGSTTTSSESCRQAMLVDLTALQSNLDALHTCRPARGKEHIQEYLRATGLPEDEMLEWVRDNWQNYAYQVSFFSLNSPCNVTFLVVSSSCSSLFHAHAYLYVYIWVSICLYLYLSLPIYLPIQLSISVYLLCFPSIRSIVFLSAEL